MLLVKKYRWEIVHFEWKLIMIMIFCWSEGSIDHLLGVQLVHFKLYCW